MTTKRYKYGHIFFVDELKFSTKIVEMLVNPVNGFYAEDFVFATPHEDVYNGLKDVCNAELVDKKDMSKMVNMYAERCDWLFLHSVPPLYKRIFIHPKHLKKIMWRTWGHDATQDYKEGDYARNLIKGLCYQIWKWQVRRLRAVGISNTVDMIDIRNRYGDVRMLRMPDTSGADEEAVLDDISMDKKPYVNVLVGHSGFERDNHVEIINKLNKIDSERIKIYLILSYGVPEYIEKVCDYVESHHIENVTILKDFMPYEEYIEFIKNIDIGILDAEISYALGNIEWLLHFKKKVFLNRNGVIKQAFDYDHVPYACTDDLTKMSYEEFVAPVDYTGARMEMLAYPYEKNVECWRHILENE